MGIQIEDGLGTGQSARVSENRLETSSRMNPRIAYISRDKGDAYAWVHSYDYDAGDTILLVSNNSTTQDLYIHKINVGSDTATKYTVHSPAYPTLAGTSITGVNLNRTSGKTAEAEAYGDETGNTQANVLYEGHVQANEDKEIETRADIILGYRDVIAVDLETAGTSGIVTIVGYFEDR